MIVGLHLLMSLSIGWASRPECRVRVHRALDDQVEARRVGWSGVDLVDAVDGTSVSGRVVPFTRSLADLSGPMPGKVTYGFTATGPPRVVRGLSKFFPPCTPGWYLEVPGRLSVVVEWESGTLRAATDGRIQGMPDGKVLLVTPTQHVFQHDGTFWGGVATSSVAEGEFIDVTHGVWPVTSARFWACPTDGVCARFDP